MCTQRKMLLMPRAACQHTTHRRLQRRDPERTRTRTFRGLSTLCRLGQRLQARFRRGGLGMRRSQLGRVRFALALTLHFVLELPLEPLLLFALALLLTRTLFRSMQSLFRLFAFQRTFLREALTLTRQFALRHGAHVGIEIRTALTVLVKLTLTFVA